MHLVVARGEIVKPHLYDDTWAVGVAFETPA
jgi:hypothetical protein